MKLPSKTTTDPITADPVVSLDDVSQLAALHPVADDLILLDPPGQTDPGEFTRIQTDQIASAAIHRAMQTRLIRDRQSFDQGTPHAPPASGNRHTQHNYLLKETLNEIFHGCT